MSVKGGKPTSDVYNQNMGIFENWCEAAQRLGVTLGDACQVSLPACVQSEPILHIPDFGGTRGTLVFHDLGSADAAILAQSGYYTSVFPSGSTYWQRPMTDADLIEVLSDWGWSGSIDRHPEWLKAT